MGYEFKRAISDPSHFVNLYIDYAKDCTDAAWDFHEALAYYLMSLATHGLQWYMPGVKVGMRTNLYILQYGPSRIARKSHAMKLAQGVQQAALPGVAVTPQFTPKGFAEQLAERPQQSSAVWIDEFTKIIVQMATQSWMSDLRQMFLTMYTEEDHAYRLSSKGQGAKKSVDEVVIAGASVSILGNITPAIIQHIKPFDIEDGFLARFAIISPTHRPKRKSQRELFEDIGGKNDLVRILIKIRERCQYLRNRRSQGGIKDTVIRTDRAVDIIDEFQAENERPVEGSDTVDVMVECIGEMAIKLAILNAVGRPGAPGDGPVEITAPDAESAVETARKWRQWATTFTGSMYHNEFERLLMRAEAFLRRKGGRQSRREISRMMHLPKRQLDEVEFTLVERGIIRIDLDEGKKKPIQVWALRKEEP
jgi:hypothetical protein